MKKHTSLFSALVALSFILTTLLANASTINPELKVKNWRAYWITDPTAQPNAMGVYHFRKQINLKAKPDHYVVHVSADNRYQLFVNGTLVSLGPARGDLRHWNYETVDIAPWLSAGDNTLAATVWNYGEPRPLAQISNQTAFILQGDSKAEAAVNTNPSWLCIRDKGYGELKPQVLGYFVAPYGEVVNMNESPKGWQETGCQPQGWQKAVTVSAGSPKGGMATGDTGWMLVPSTLPQMERTQQRLATVRKAEGVKVPKGFLAGKAPLVIPAHSHAVLLLDNGHNTDAYVHLDYQGGRAATMALTYAESLYDNTTMEKGNRNDIEGKHIFGVKDSIISDGDSKAVFQSLNWKTFRYIQVSIQTQDEPLTISDLYAVYTGYPFQRRATFAASDPSLGQMLDIGWRTARLCSMETYMDCPYYEQLQYLGDTRLQMLISYYNAGNDTLARKAICDIDNSRLAEGITEGRYPAYGDNIISPFALMWIGMLHDYYMYRPDSSFVQAHLPGMRQVLSFFSSNCQADGSLKDLPYWNFVDWVEHQRQWKMGVPPKGTDGCSAVLDLLLLRAYQWANMLEAHLGNKGMAEEYGQKAKQLAATIQRKYWDEGRQLYADTSDKHYFSQHANALAILTGLIKGDKAREVAQRMIAGTDMAEASIYFKYYVNRSLTVAGLGDDYLNHLDIWRDYMKLGMTTWGEDSKLTNTRSDCHAWSASPNIEFFRTVLGIDTDAPGFSHVRIAPHLGSLSHAEGSIPHTLGIISVSYKLSKDKLHAVIDLPQGLSGTFVWKGNIMTLKPGKNIIP